VPVIDLNADLGEGFGAWDLGDDAALLGAVTSANVACGFHAGDPERLLGTLRGTAAAGASVGAHPSYRDLVGFGRRFVDASPTELHADVLYQIAALQGLARAAGTVVRYVKPHGALYNRIAHDPVHADAVIAAVSDVDPALPVLGLAGSPFLERARAAGLRAVPEVFADRGYRADGSLVPRGEPGALLHDAQTIAERMARFATEGVMAAVDGTLVALEAESICVHGDTPGAVAAARAVRAELERAGIVIRAFAG
jgi:UPF0271 protein